MFHLILKNRKNNSQTLILLLLTLVGGILRIINLTDKPIWIDEVATLVFSLGNSFQNIPLNQIVTNDILLDPLYVSPSKGIKDVIETILMEDTHPPLYFILAHFWGHLFDGKQGLTSLLGQRSFAAFWGMISIPCIYIFTRFSFNSSIAGQLAAALMAVSPFGIYLAQEARHYTFSIILIIASLSCLTIFLQKISRSEHLSFRFICLWISLNGVGIATHYFFGFALFSIITTCIILAFYLFQKHTKLIPHNSNLLIKSDYFQGVWKSILWIVFGSIVSVSIWVPVIYRNRGYGELISWLSIDPSKPIEWIYPPFQALASWLPMLFLFPVESHQKFIAILSAFFMLIIFAWITPVLKKGLDLCLAGKETSRITQSLIIFVIASNVCFFGVIYLFGVDLTRAPRYAFVYFPAVITLLGASLAFTWNHSSQIQYWGINGKQLVTTILLISFLGSLTVTYDLGFKKSHQSDTLAFIINKHSRYNPLVITFHKSLTQAGEMMSLAWEFQSYSQKPSFLLLNETDETMRSLILHEKINGISKPIDIWLVNAKYDLDLISCVSLYNDLPLVNGYNYQHCIISN